MFNIQRYYHSYHKVSVNVKMTVSRDITYLNSNNPIFTNKKLHRNNSKATDKMKREVYKCRVFKKGVFELLESF